MAMTDCLYVTLGPDMLRNCSLCIWKHVEFEERRGPV